MPTRGELKAVAQVLSNPQNSDLTAEEVAEKAIEAYEAQRAKTHNLIVLGHFRLDNDTSFVSAVGPLSSRAVTAARDMGERFAWDWRTKRGTGKFVRVPLIRDPHAAWDAARAATDVETEQLVIGEALEDALSIQMDDQLTARYGPTCICGLPDRPRYNSLGHLASIACQLHPEGTHGGEHRTGRANGGDPQRGEPTARR